MPVLSDSHHPSPMSVQQMTANNVTSHSTYLILSLAILVTLGLRLRQQRRGESISSGSIRSSTHKSIFPSAQTMQTPPSSSALPEKPFLPDLELAAYDVGLGKASLDGMENLTTDATSKTTVVPEFTNPQLPSLEAALSPSSKLEATTRGSVSIHLTQPRRTGSLIHPEPPAPTISMKEPAMKIQTHLPYKPVKEYHFEDLQPEYQAQYTYNEILFVPSPTEYTSFEALYNRFPPPIYHEPNPTSYTSISASEISDSESRSYSTASFSGNETNVDHRNSQDIARRRSYTKTLSNGSEMSGEITISSGKGEGETSRQWRRHTRVFGGGTCMACEESEHRRVSS